MTAPTSPGVVPADVRELVERLRHADQNSPQRIVGSRIFCEAADMIERLANRPSLTEDEREQVRREALEAVDLAVQTALIDAAHTFRGQDGTISSGIFKAQTISANAIRALADRSEPRQEKEGKA